MRTSHFSKDVQEFLKLLAANKVKTLIVGGEAVIYHGYARLTGDVDFFFEPSRQNARKLYAALKEFWSGDIPGIKAFDELLEEGLILQFGVPPNRIDLINQVSGVTFREAWENRIKTSIESTGREVPVYLIGLEELIKNKKAIGRPKDMEDLKYLRGRRKLGRSNRL
jgi:predicted nucleotidyltransferase